MAATSLISSSYSNVFSFHPISGTTRNPNLDVSSTRVFASSRKGPDHVDKYYQNYTSRLVDENVIVLRKRVHEMKMVERNYEPPSDWMDWEKRYYTTYDSFICQVMGILQSQLMNTRPSFALAFLALIVLSVPTSTVTVFFHFLELAKGVPLYECVFRTMKMVKRNYEPPSDWMDWEKRYYTTYDSFICRVMGLLRSQLMNTRPSFALAFLALIVLSVPTSTLTVFFHFLDLAKGVGLH